MPYSQSTSPGRTLTTADRTNSTTSIGRSPPVKGKGHRAHLAGHGRIHSRNLSYGKNLNKLTKLADDAEEGEAAPTSEVKRRPDSGSDGKAGKAAKAAASEAQRSGLGSEGKAGKAGGRSKGLTTPTSPSAASAMAQGATSRHDSSTASLPRTGSKANVKRNSSNLSLKKYAVQAPTQPSKANRTSAQLRKNHSRGADLDKLGQPRETRFILDDDEEEVGVGDTHDDEWTEESASRSPSVTRHSSKRTSRKSSPVEEMRRPQVDLAHARGSKAMDAPNGLQKNSASSYIAVSYPNHTSRPPDADTLASRLFGRSTSVKFGQQVPIDSVTGTPETYTPPTSTHTHDQPEGSLPEHGVSRFLGAHSSGSVVESFNQKPSFSGLSSIRSSPPSNSDGDPVRRTKSSVNLQSTSTKPTVRFDSPERADRGGGTKPGGLRSATFEPTQQRRANFTQVRMELWRNQTAIEPSHGPPAPIISRLPVAELGLEERRVRQWEEAELQLNYLKRFRNPIVDGARRAVRAHATGDGVREPQKRNSTVGFAASRKNRSRERIGGSMRDLPLRAHESSAHFAESERGRPPSRHEHRAFNEPSHRGTGIGGHRVRFEVGLDGEDGMVNEDEGNGNGSETGGTSGEQRALEALIRGMWTGGEKGGDD